MFPLGGALSQHMEGFVKWTQHSTVTSGHVYISEREFFLSHWAEQAASVHTCKYSSPSLRTQ